MLRHVRCFSCRSITRFKCRSAARFLRTSCQLFSVALPGAAAKESKDGPINNSDADWGHMVPRCWRQA
jgi:hypothetical protein